MYSVRVMWTWEKGSEQLGNASEVEEFDLAPEGCLQKEMASEVGGGSLGRGGGSDRGQVQS